MIGLKQVKRRGFKTREEALEAEAKMLAEKDLTSNLTFAQVADKYFEWYCQGKAIFDYSNPKCDIQLLSTRVRKNECEYNYS